ncbi:S8 family serine peptidase [Planosporangium sp. 12N6]|uniref:S8 family serine peptidase n=1 Tax=Planosporangium spinosum TaxID=3402278 RepID=UPI003CECECB8
MRFLVRPRLRAGMVAGLVMPAVLAVTGSPAVAAYADPGPEVPVIVQYDDAAAAAKAVARVGGVLGRRFEVAQAYPARVPASGIGALRAAPGVRAVTPDGAVALTGKDWISDKDDLATYAVSSATGVAQTIGAPDVWKKKDASGRPITGTGVGVALIDSGIVPVEGLTDSSRIVNGPDLSFESQTPDLRSLDTFGHGTHMAGIIAGRDTGVTPGTEPPTGFVGVAPGATLVNIKVAAADGSVDVSQVIAAIDWVVAHRDDPGLNIRVLNLSFGTDSMQDPRFDPLSFAVEAAWRKGIVVVVAAGNSGSGATRLGMPAMNPYVLAVGGADQRGTLPTGDDAVGDFSSRGSSVRHADLLAPGRSIVSLRDPNSFIDTNYPTGLLPASIDPGLRFFRGTGTSQAAAVVSGAAALLLQQRPDLTPDQVKRLLTATATPLKGSDAISQGAGEINVKKAVATATPKYTQAAVPSLGTGSLEGARGAAHVVDPDTGVELTGEQDIMGNAFDAACWSVAAGNGSAWIDGTWNGAAWTGADWSTTTPWSGRTWSGTTWEGLTWSGRTWSGATWDGRTWSGRTWSGTTWSGRTWSGGYWSGTTWD